MIVKAGTLVRITKPDAPRSWWEMHDKYIGKTFILEHELDTSIPYSSHGAFGVQWYAEELVPVLNDDNLTEGRSMNIATFARLNKEQRQLAKAGIINDHGDLTIDGQTVVLEMLAKEEKVQTALITLAKEFNKKAE
jgi:hypothetical protein